MNRASIGAINFEGSAIGCPVSRANDFGVRKQITMYGCGKFDRQLYGLVVSDSAEFKFRHVFSLPFVRLQHEVTIDDHAHRETRPDRQRRLDIEIALNDLLPGLVQAIAGSETERCDDTTIAASTGGGSELASNAKQRRQQRSLEQRAPVIVDLILKTGIACAYRRRAGAPARSNGRSA